MNLIERYRNKPIAAKEIKVNDLLIVVGYRIPKNQLSEKYILKIGETLKVRNIRDCRGKICNDCPSTSRAIFVIKPDEPEKAYASCWYRFRTLDGRLII